MSYPSKPEAFTPYAAVSDESTGFGSADVYFRSTLAPDNRLYMQLSDTDNTVVGFEVVDIEIAGIVRRLDEFEEIYGAVADAEIKAGDNCLFCFARMNDASLVFLFSEADELDFSLCMEYLTLGDAEEEIGGAIEFLSRVFDNDHTALYVRHAIESSKSAEFPKIAAFLYLSSSDIINTAQLIDFFQHGEVSIGAETIVEIGLASTVSESNNSAITKELLLLFPTAKVSVRYATKDLPLDNAGAEKTAQEPLGTRAAQTRLKRRKTPKQARVYQDGFTGADLEALRTNLGYSRSEFAGLISVSSDRVRKWENKRSTENINFDSQKLAQLQELATSPDAGEAGWLIKGGKARTRNKKRILRLFDQYPEIELMVELSRSTNSSTFIATNPYSGVLGNKYDQAAIKSLASANFVKRDDETDEIQRIETLVDLLCTENFRSHRYLTLASENQDSLLLFMIYSDFRSNKADWSSWFQVAFGRELSDEELEKIGVDSLNELSIKATKLF